MRNNKKNSELNFLYLDEKYANQKSQKKNNRADQKSAPKRNSNSKKKTNKYKKSNERTFNFDNEIVIGVTPVSEKSKSTNKEKNVKNKSVKTNKHRTNKNTKSKNVRIKNNKRKVSFTAKVIKWTVLIIALIASFIFFMMSPLFNVIEIKVLNNQKISTDSIISLSGLQLGENIYKTSSKRIAKNIKQEPYIDTVKVSRKLPNIIEISVEERIVTYMLEYANSYAYINNQGYILEISQEAIQVPIIFGYSTKEEDIKLGNRINSADLEKLQIVLKIIESANVNDMGGLITKIDISNKQNYTLILESEKKTIYIGDASNLSHRMPYIKEVIEYTSGLEGEIFANGDLNTKKVFFREKIK